MVQTCKKISEGDWMVLVSATKDSNSILTIRGSFKTRKCAQADARRARKAKPGSFVEVIRRADIPSYLSKRSEYSRSKACDKKSRRRKNCPCEG